MSSNMEMCMVKSAASSVEMEGLGGLVTCIRGTRRNLRAENKAVHFLSSRVHATRTCDTLRLSILSSINHCFSIRSISYELHQKHTRRAALGVS